MPHMKPDLHYKTSWNDSREKRYNTASHSALDNQSGEALNFVLSVEP